MANTLEEAEWAIELQMYMSSAHVGMRRKIKYGGVK